jgi:hypothetical protein
MYVMRGRGDVVLEWGGILEDVCLCTTVVAGLRCSMNLWTGWSRVRGDSRDVNAPSSSPGPPATPPFEGFHQLGLSLCSKIRSKQCQNSHFETLGN